MTASQPFTFPAPSPPHHTMRGTTKRNTTHWYGRDAGLGSGNKLHIYLLFEFRCSEEVYRFLVVLDAVKKKSRRRTSTESPRFSFLFFFQKCTWTPAKRVHPFLRLSFHLVSPSLSPSSPFFAVISPDGHFRLMALETRDARQWRPSLEMRAWDGEIVYTICWCMLESPKLKSEIRYFVSYSIKTLA